jgi:ABC-type Mn2+/Zn2+ transport system permease subunit
MEAIQPFLDNGFLRNALGAGVLAAWACAVVGTYMVLRGLSFIGDALSHGVLPGVAGALLLGLPGLAGAAVGSVVMIGGISLIQRRTRLSGDTAIGLLFVGMLALGVVLVSRSNSFSGDLIKILFGEILASTPGDLALQAAALTVTASLAWLLRRPFLLLCFSPEHAQVSGYSPRLLHLVMLSMIAATVIVCFQTVGTMLVFGLLVAPAATAALFARRMGAIMAGAGLAGSLAVFVGLSLSYQFNLAAGASITVTAVGLFFLALPVKSWLDARVRHG